MPGRRQPSFLLGKVAIDGALSTAIPVTGAGGGGTGITVAPPLALTFGRVTVATAGTRVNAPAGALTQGVTVRGLTTNTGLVFVGGATVSSANGYSLNPSESVFVACDNLSDVWVDVAVSGNGICYVGG